FDLDRAQSRERAAGDELSARTVGSRKHHDQLVLGWTPDAVEAAQLRSECAANVCEGLPQELFSVLARELAEVAHRDEQAAQRRPVTGRAVDLFLQPLGGRRGG